VIPLGGGLVFATGDKTIAAIAFYLAIGRIWEGFTNMHLANLLSKAAI
jgi:hypothetical protein